MAGKLRGSRGVELLSEEKDSSYDLCTAAAVNTTALAFLPTSLQYLDLFGD